MSRIILSRYQTGQERFVVGWDHPCGGAFWQEFNLEPPELEDGTRDYEGWQEVIREGGFFPGIPLEKFEESVPEDLRPLITVVVMDLLRGHANDPDSGYRKGVVDLAAA
jgi:hypothetical protein